MDIFEKLARIREGIDPNYLETINQWENNLRETGERINAVNLKPVREYLERIANKVAENKKRLSENSQIDETERAMLFAEIKVYNEVLNYFISAKGYAQAIEKEINETFNSLEK